MQFVSWNVNGLRSIYKKGFLNWFGAIRPDVLCIQETKAHEKQLPEDLRNIKGYNSYYSHPERKGYSGVALYSKIEPISIEKAFSKNTIDDEGRIIISRYEKFTLMNIYFPNGKMSQERLDYKLEFYKAFLDECKLRMEKGEELLVCGDVNTAHKEKDIARPKQNENVSGFLPEEREWLDRFIDEGLVDTFRMFNGEGGHYSWWDYKTRARERNVGWRIDYFFASRGITPKIKASYMLSEIMGSDHCPIVLDMEI